MIQHGIDAHGGFGQRFGHHISGSVQKLKGVGRGLQQIIGVVAAGDGQPVDLADDPAPFYARPSEGGIPVDQTYPQVARFVEGRSVAVAEVLTALEVIVVLLFFGDV